MFTTIALLLTTTAGAADLELDGQLGRTSNSDSAYRVFSDVQGMPSRGIRVGARAMDNLVIVGGWHRVSRGANLDLGDGGNISTAFFADEFTIGPKLDVGIGEWFYPYITAQGMLFRGVMKFDDKPSTKDNPNQLSAAGLAPGLLALGGVELRIPQKDGPVTIAYHIELGHSVVGNANYGEFGDMKPGGSFALRSGLGLRF